MVEGVADRRDPSKATSGDISVRRHDGTRSGPDRRPTRRPASPSTSVASGDRLRLTGVAGQRASRKGAADGYRVWLRGSGDLVRLGGSLASPGPAPSSSAGPAASPGGAIRTIAAAILAGQRNGHCRGIGHHLVGAARRDAPPA